MKNSPFDVAIEQRQMLDTLLSRSGLTRRDIERLIVRPDLVQKMVRTFEEELLKEFQFFDWNPIDVYGDKVRDWNQRLELGLSENQIDNFERGLVDHRKPFQPTSITFTVGESARQNHNVSMQILSFELERVGVRFVDHLGEKSVFYFEGSEPREGTHLASAPLDIEVFWEPERGVSHREVSRRCPRWPTHEIALLLAINTHIFLRMDQSSVPFFVAAGLMVGADDVMVFGRDGDEVFVRGGWSGNTRRSIVAFREV